MNELKLIRGHMLSFRNFTIHQRLFAISVAVTCGMLLLLAIMLNQSSSQHLLGEANVTAHSISRQVVQLRNYEKNFLLRLEVKYANQHQQAVQALLQDLTKLRSELADFDINTQGIGQFEQLLQNYSTDFNKISELRVQAGLTENDGLIGEMRTAARQLEKLLLNKGELVQANLVLQLRRHEKDFQLRMTLKEQQLFATKVAQLTPMLSGDELAALQQYNRAFNRLVEVFQQIGLHQDDGMMDVMRASIHATEQQMLALKQQVDAELAQALSHSQTVSISCFVLLVLMLSLLLWLVSRSVIQPVRQLRSVIADIRRDQDFTRRIDPQGDDELTALSVDLNALLSDVQNLVRTVNQSLLALDQSTQQLNQSARNTSQSMQLQQSETDMVATAVTEMGATIHEIAQTTENTADKAQATNSHAVKGMEQVASTVTQVQQLSARLADAAETAVQLDADSVTIGSVLEVIRTIADQTNLLALNAAIEAARAGEQGRGFAVVADEVRMLATKTQDSTKQIELIIRALQQRSKAIVAVMQQCQQQGEQSAHQGQTAMLLLREITADVSLIMDMTTQIAAAIEEQSHVAAEVNKNVVSIRDLSEDTLQGAKQNHEISQAVASQTADVHHLVDKFRV
jgi:methyl-accepting chemotaxis protein